MLSLIAASFAHAQNPANAVASVNFLPPVAVDSIAHPVSTQPVVPVPTPIRVVSAEPSGSDETPRGALSLPVNLGETSISLDVGFGIRPVPPSRVTVPLGERLRITAPEIHGVTYIWTKNGRAIPGAATPTLTLDYVTTDDAATYACLFSMPTTLPQTSQLLILGVGPTDRLVNLSMRGMLRSGAGETFIVGFVVNGSSAKKLIVRAIGPSLAQFNVPNVLRRPVLRIYDGQNRPYSNGYAYPAVVGGLTYETDLAGSLARAGAFPTARDSGDAVLLMPFTPGSYTAQVSSADSTGGDVMIEVYEVP